MELEWSMQEAALKVARGILEVKLNEDKSDYHGPAYHCSCGGTAVYRGRREKSFVTVVGERPRGPLCAVCMQLAAAPAAAAGTQ